MNKNLPNRCQFESGDKMESDPSQSNSPLISTSPITKNIPMEERLEVNQHEDKNAKAEISKVIDIMKAGLQAIQVGAAEKYKVEIAQLKESNEKLQAENLKLKEADKTDKEKLALKEETIHTLQNENVELKESNEKLQTEIASLQTTLNNSVASNSKLRKGKSKLQKELKSQMNDTKNELNIGICDKIEKIQMQNQNKELTKENGFLKAVAPSICYFNDVVVNGKIDYRKLKNVFVVDKLEQKVDGKWYADNNEYSFKKSNSNIFVKEELYICSDLNTVVNRGRFYNLKNLHIHNSTITYSDLKNIVSSCNYIHCLHLDFVTVKNKYGAVIGIDQLIKDVLQNKPNIEKFIYGFISGKNVSEIAQKLSQLPVFHHIVSIKKFVLHNIQEGFDLKAFSEFIKKYPRSEYQLEFYGSDKYYTQIKDTEKEIRPALPETCKLDVCRRFSF